MISTVLIDIDNTLLDFNKCSLSAIKMSFGENGIKFDKVFHSVFIRINDGLWAKFERKEITREQIYGVRFKLVLDELNIDGDFNKIETDYRNALYYCADTVAGAKKVVKYLSSKYSLYAASNAMKAQQEHRLKKAGLNKYFSGLFLSHELGVAKPCKEFYQTCLKLCGAKKEEVIMIGDNLVADIKGAFDSGIKSIWYNHNKNPLPQERLYDYYVDNLNQVTKIL